MRMAWGDNWQAAAFVAAAAILILPLWCAYQIAMPDYPAHLASFYLIAGGVHDPLLSRFYHIDWQPIPNIISELTIPVLGRLTGIPLATKLFLSLSVAMWVAGPALIHRAIYGRYGIAPLAGCVFAYNGNFVWGFFNYYFASGLVLVLFAGWIASRDWPKWRRAGLFAAAGIIVYFSHLFAAALLLGMIGCYEATLLLRERPLTGEKILARFAPLAIIAAPLVVLFLLRPAGGGGPLVFNLATSWMDRLEAAIDVYYDQTDYYAIAALALAIAAASWWRKIAFHPDLLILVGALAVGSALAPEEAMGGWGVDLRLPAVFGAVLLASIDVLLPARTLMAIAAIVFAQLGLKSAALAGNWRYYDRQFTEFRTAIQSLPKGLKLMTVLDGDAIGKASDQPYWHMAEYAIIDRSAFTPLLFTTKGQHVVRLNPPFEAIAATSARQGSPPDVTELDDLAAGTPDGDWDIGHVFPYLMYFQCHYDEVVLVHLNGTRSPVSTWLRLRHAGTFFSLYDIDHTGCRSQ